MRTVTVYNSEWSKKIVLFIQIEKMENEDFKVMICVFLCRSKAHTCSKLGWKSQHERINIDGERSTSNLPILHRELLCGRVRPPPEGAFYQNHTNFENRFLPRSGRFFGILWSTEIARIWSVRINNKKRFLDLSKSSFFFWPFRCPLLLCLNGA